MGDGVGVNHKLTADRVRAVAPLLAVEQDTTHTPTVELLAALRTHGWRVTGKHQATAILFHPDFGAMQVSLTPGRDDQLSTYIDGRQVPHRVAMQRARGEA